MSDQNNLIMAIVLSALVLLAWQYFFGFASRPQRAAQPSDRGGTFMPFPGMNVPPTVARRTPTSEPARALAASPRVAIATPRLTGSVALTGGVIDDLSLPQYRETAAADSPPITLLSPAASRHPFYAEFGWVGAAGVDLDLPAAQTPWREVGTGALAVGKPVQLAWVNRHGLAFRRTISVDDGYLFTVRDEVSNNGGDTVTVSPFARVARHGTPPTSGNYLLHEGAIGVLGERGLQEVTYKTLAEGRPLTFSVTGAWLGFTDKYWAAALLPDPSAHGEAAFSAALEGGEPTYRAEYVLDARTIAPGGSSVATVHLFAGAKEVAAIDDYAKVLHLDRFELLVDWGFLRVITRPMFMLLDYLYRLVGNFGVAILIVTLLLKLAFFPLAMRSYASIARMKALTPRVQALRERYADDRVLQQQALTELYRTERVNPIAGCLPNLVQVPAFFALYKVLVITIEMRHAPFFGWITDLSAPDPTTVFNLFGLIPVDPRAVPVIGDILWLGAWPLLMGLTMWASTRLNPPPPDPTQRLVMTLMPVIFTVTLAKFPAGLVIYWAFNNALTVLQQALIMRTSGPRPSSPGRTP
jgi:YidC/Oxa1 family membrane protein insertase